LKIIINRVPSEGLCLKEEIDPSELDLDTELIKFRAPLKLEAKVERITNALSVDLKIEGKFSAECSRCLEEFEREFEKTVRLNYPLEGKDNFIDLNPEIREEIILDYPIKPLCGPECKGICLKCGKNKNEGGCHCGST